MSSNVKPPSKIDAFSFPLFAVDWFAEVTSEGHLSSWVGYCGGGGSAKTGVKNNILILRDNDLPIQLSTGDEAGGALKFYQHPQTKRMWMLVALGTKVRRYSLLPEPRLAGEVDIGEKCDVLAVSPNADQFAIGVGEDGRFKVFGISEETFTSLDNIIYTCMSHTKSLTSMAYSPQGDRIISAARDGTACIWKDGKLMCGLSCSLKDQQNAPNNNPKGRPQRPQQVLVRGCAFGDQEGRIALTVHSGRKAEAYLSRWQQTPKGKFACTEKTLCSDLPVTALSLSLDQKLLAVGVADGTVILWSTVEWKPIKKFTGVHELPVTCIAARPLPYPFYGEEVMVHARTGSLDCLTGVLTLDYKAPKKKNQVGNEGSGFYCAFLAYAMFLVHLCFMLFLIYLGLNSMFPKAQSLCMNVYKRQGLESAAYCFFEEVVYMDPSNLGIPIPPH